MPKPADWNQRYAALTADLIALELDETDAPSLKKRMLKGMRPVIGVIKCKGESLWMETEMLISIDRAALSAGELGKTKLMFGEGT